MWKIIAEFSVSFADLFLERKDNKNLDNLVQKNLFNVPKEWSGKCFTPEAGKSMQEVQYDAKIGEIATLMDNHTARVD